MNLTIEQLDYAETFFIHFSGLSLLRLVTLLALDIVGVGSASQLRQILEQKQVDILLRPNSGVGADYQSQVDV